MIFNRLKNALRNLQSIYFVRFAELQESIKITILTFLGLLAKIDIKLQKGRPIYLTLQ